MTSTSLYVLARDREIPVAISALLDMLAYARHTTVQAVDGLSVEQLDHRHDAISNSIGALLAHVGAVEAWYQQETFGIEPWPDAESPWWKAALDLGSFGARVLREQPLEFYLRRLADVRQRTETELRKRDEAWLLASHADANNYWRWFHVCEDEINHRGQIRWLRKRLR